MLYYDQNLIKFKKVVASTERKPEIKSSQRDVSSEKRLKDLGLPKLSKF